MAVLHHPILCLLVSSFLLHTVAAHREEEQAVLFKDREEEQAHREEEQAVLYQDATNLSKNEEQQQAVLLQAMPRNEGQLYAFHPETRRMAPVRRSVPSSKLAWQALKIPRWKKKTSPYYFFCNFGYLIKLCYLLLQSQQF